MTGRTHSVVVVPERWTGPREELAGQIASVARQPAGRLERALARGPVALETDLQRSEAGTLRERLARLGIPARVEDAEGEVVEPVDDSDEGVEEPPDEPDLEAALEAFGEELDAELVATEVEEGAPDGNASEPETTGDDPWGDVLDSGGEGGGTESESTTADRVEAGDGRDEAPRDASLEPLGVDSDEAEDASLDLDLEPDGGEPPGEQSGDAALDSTAVAADDRAASAPSTDGSSVDRTADGESDLGPPAGVEPTSGGPGGSRAHGDDAVPDDFDTRGLAEALEETTSSGSTSGREGFDDRPEHLPWLAGLLSLLAPGAGQMYNDETERAWQYGYRAILLVPWIRSVIEAYRIGSSIRAGDRRRPRPGAFWRALGYLAVWYGVVAGIAVVGVLGTRLVFDFSGSTPTVEPVDEHRARAVERARLGIDSARIAAISAAREERKKSKSNFTVDDRERALRLFEIGYEHCLARKYDMCEATMRKVGRLEESFRQPAFRLQAWSSVQKNPEVPPKPMPELDLPDPLAELVEKIERRGRPEKRQTGKPRRGEPAEPGRPASEGSRRRPDPEFYRR
ncbi:MAG: hypothetical protein ABEL76_14425 [Bradymonadaceae bacterium]